MLPGTYWREKYEKEQERNNLARANEPRPTVPRPAERETSAAADSVPVTRPNYSSALTGSNNVPIAPRKETQLQHRPATPYRHPSPVQPGYRVPPPVNVRNFSPSVPRMESFTFTVPTVNSSSSSLSAGNGTFGSMF